MKSNDKLLMTLSFLWLTVIMCLGGWWLFLMVNFDNFLSKLDRFTFSKMLFWEGSAFIVLLILLSISLFIFYLQNQKKTKSLQDFFASLTHELKTPLASIKLQGEVISEILDTKDEPKLKKLLSRLNQDTLKLEIQMDKILQLSRIERGGELNLTSVNLLPFIKNTFNFWKNDLELKINCNIESPCILADEFALELIFKNLFENTKNHSKSNQITISISEIENHYQLTYNDHGTFNGDRHKLSNLFYKFNSTKGSGIGLYLIKKLTHKMNSHFNIIFVPELSFQFEFKKCEGHHA